MTFVSIFLLYILQVYVDVTVTTTTKKLTAVTANSNLIQEVNLKTKIKNNFFLCKCNHSLGLRFKTILLTMDKDKDKLVPLQKLLKENTPIAGTSNETSDNIYQNIKMETKDFSDSSDEDSSEQKSKIGKKRGSVKLPVHLKGLMGEANLRFARGR